MSVTEVKSRIGAWRIQMQLLFCVVDPDRSVVFEHLC